MSPVQLRQASICFAAVVRDSDMLIPDDYNPQGSDSVAGIPQHNLKSCAECALTQLQVGICIICLSLLAPGFPGCLGLLYGLLLRPWVWLTVGSLALL
jgi:hypothetical protein